jgi:hypothetical protein
VTVLDSADSASTDVNVIGSENVPDALIEPPFKTTIAGAGSVSMTGSPYTEVPAAMVSVTPDCTKSCEASR